MTYVIKAMFRRHGWHRMQQGAKEPVWHRTDPERMEARTESQKALGTLVAMCGYQRDQFMEGVQQRDEIKTAAKRCAKCDKKAGVTR